MTNTRMTAKSCGFNLFRPSVLAWTFFTFFALCLRPLPASGATNIVRIVNFAFQPKLLTNNVGDTVLWTNTTLTGHNVVSSNSAWAAPALFTSPGTFAVTFTNPGTYGYYCSPHLLSGMTGIIFVRSPSQPRFDTNLALVAGSLPLRLTVTPSFSYAIDYTTDFSSWVLFTNFVATGSTTNFFDAVTGRERRFYRARWVPGP